MATTNTIPESIRVYRSEDSTIDVINFKDYVKGVLPAEWLSYWPEESLKAGAICAKTYGWYWINQGGKPTNADVYDDIRDQVYREETFDSPNQAVDTTWTTIMTRNGEIFESQYWNGLAEVFKVGSHLHIRAYPDVDSQEIGEVQLGGEVIVLSTGIESTGTDGYTWFYIKTGGMYSWDPNQYETGWVAGEYLRSPGKTYDITRYKDRLSQGGTKFWADQGLHYQEILEYYYPDIQFSTTSDEDNIYPTVNSLSVSPSSVTLGSSFTISYSVSDTGGSGLNRVELWRADDSGGSPVNWDEVKRTSASGNSYSGSFTDVPSLGGTYWYGIHVADNAGNWNDEQNSLTDGLPGDYGPVEVTVRAHALPDLIIENIQVSTDRCQVGQSVTINYEIKNLGGEFTNTFDTVVRIDQTDGDPTYIDLAFSENLYPIAAGSSRVETIELPILSWFDPGDYWVEMIVDTNYEIVEENEDNNVGRAANTLELYLPDEEIQHDIYLESQEANYASDNKGQIHFASSQYSLPYVIQKTDGSYSVDYTPEFNFEFVGWETEGSISVSNEYSKSTTATINGYGTLRAVYQTTDDSPDTCITFGPNDEIDYNDVSFTWTGYDDVTSVSNLVYSYMLDGYETLWSSWTSNTRKEYNGLPNGVYVFKVKAKDEAGHEDPTPELRHFTVNVVRASATLTDLVAPSEVYTGEVFTVEVTVSYEFTDPTTIGPGIWDVEAGAYLAEDSEILVGEGTRTYSFDLTAPEEETIWELDASVWYILEDEWTHNEEEYLEAFDISVVHAPVSLPHQFWGAVTIDGVAASDGTEVEAKIDGITYEETTTSGGRYGWDPEFQVPADDPDTAQVEGGVNGDIVDFYVGGIYATNYVFSSGGADELDLAVTVLEPIPPMPHQFYGTVTVDGLPAPDGLWVDIVISTADGGEFYYSALTSGGMYGWDEPFRVPADDPDTTEIEGGVNGDIVWFWVDIDNYVTSYVFESGGITELNLDYSTDIYELQLYEGWNLISIPGIPVDPSIEVTLYDILDNVESVWAFDGETKTWSSYSPGAPSDLTEMVEGRGYWIKMTTDMVWEMDIG